MTIAAGNVGIGTASPVRPLQVEAGNSSWVSSVHNTSAAAGASGLVVRSDGSGDILQLQGAGGAGAERVRITNAGNVGIGTADPQRKLHIADGGSMEIGRDYAGANGIYKTFSTAHLAGSVPSQLDFWFNDSTGAGMSIKSVRDGSFNSQSIEFGTHHGGISAGTRMTIDKDGNVGIGTTGPAATLDVGGTGALKMPVGTTAQRPATPATGMMRFNSNTLSVEYYNGTACGWHRRRFPPRRPRREELKPRL